MATLKKFVPPVEFHPGITLSEKLKEMGMSVKEFAVRTSKPEKTIFAVIGGKSSVTSDMAVALLGIRVGTFLSFGQDDGIWVDSHDQDRRRKGQGSIVFLSGQHRKGLGGLLPQPTVKGSFPHIPYGNKRATCHIRMVAARRDTGGRNGSKRVLRKSFA